MSSTSRGGVRSEQDWYETQPADALPMIQKLRPIVGDRPTIWEPTAGRGALVKLLRAQFPAALIEANEIDAERYQAIGDKGANLVTNYDLFDLPKFPVRALPFDLAFTNPPFVTAQQVAERLIPLAAHVVLLQRVNWLASLDRLDFWRRNAADVWLLPKRPSFAASLKCARKGDGCDWARLQYLDADRPTTCPKCQAKALCSTNDSIEYAWFHFHAGSLRQYGHLGRAETAKQGSLLAGVA